MITRGADPATVVETGVLYGYSSAAILSALADNKKGRLISIDLPTEAHQSVIVDRQYIQVGLPSDEFSVGCAIPIPLRKRWSLRLGNALELLPKILEETGPISIFIHDSLHTYDHMMGEFRLGYDALEPGGLMIADDIGYNAAWQDFCRSKNQDWRVLSKGPDALDQFGFLTKSPK
jgi:predicted O-methyltransferase YrrM